MKVLFKMTYEIDLNFFNTANLPLTIRNLLFWRSMYAETYFKFNSSFTNIKRLNK